MNGDPHARVAFTLELVVGADPPEGRLLAAGDARDFAGWLGLALAIERAIAENDAAMSGGSELQAH